MPEDNTTQTEQAAQGSTQDYCSNSSSGQHFMVHRCRGGALVSVHQCTRCSWIDFDDLDAQVRACNET